MRDRVYTLAARYIFPVEGEPVPDGRIEIRNGLISKITRGAAASTDLDLGNVAVLPGFVNAHTHLELDTIPASSDIGSPENEVEWLGRVIEQRRNVSERALRGIVSRNLSATIASGVTTIADVASGPLSWTLAAESAIRGVVFREVIGLRRERGLQTSQEAWEWIASIGIDPDVEMRLRPGISPHAPYSTAGWLYERAAGSRLPLCTHLAEMPEELELLRSRSGPLRRFLESIGAWDHDWKPVGDRPADYVRKGDLRRADWLIAHGTYLEPTDYWQLRSEAAPEGQRVAVVYCPRTHDRFGHAPHPYRGMLEKGVIVCLGTDSVASSPSLSILDEIRFLHGKAPSLGGALLLTMATLFGAWALRLETEVGSLLPDKHADLAIVPLPDRDEDDPYQLLLESDFPAAGTVIGGEFVSGRWAGFGR